MESNTMEIRGKYSLDMIEGEIIIYQTSKSNISEYIKHILGEKELNENNTKISDKYILQLETEKLPEKR